MHGFTLIEIELLNLAVEMAYKTHQGQVRNGLVSKKSENTILKKEEKT